MMLRYLIFKRAYHSNPNTIQWNKTIRNHQANGNYQQALKLFQLGIEKQTFQPNSLTYLTILDICKELKSLSTVRTIHQLIDSSKTIDEDISNDPRIRSLLMNVYIKCQDIDSAYRVFQSMKERNIVDYGALMSGFNTQRQYEKTCEFFREIPSSIKYSSPILCTLMLQACSELKRYDDGLKIHQYGKDFLSHDKIFRNELLNFYLKFHQEKFALEIFDKYPNQQTIIDYSLLMKYYNRQYQPSKTLELYFRLKQNSHFKIDHIISVLVLQAIANGCCLHTSQQISQDMKIFGTNIDVNNALINMYGN
jgi:pentatricopeptide repeat protein